MRRTAVINQTRSLLLERGITLRKGRCHLETALPGIIEDATALVHKDQRGRFPNRPLLGLISLVRFKVSWIDLRSIAWEHPG